MVQSATDSGDPYKPSVIRTYEIALRRRVLPALGAYRLADLRRTDLQDFADRLLATGTDPSTIKNTLMPLRAIYRRHVARGDLAVNPTASLELPAVRGTRASSLTDCARSQLHQPACTGRRVVEGSQRLAVPQALVEPCFVKRAVGQRFGD
jgi:site-specific recombinase XerD